MYEVGGVDILVLPWCETAHFFTVVAKCGFTDSLFYLESVGGYQVPKVIGTVRQFLHEIRTSKGLLACNAPLTFFEGPKQYAGSNDCGIFMLETMKMILRI